ncbi:MAG: prolyl oligopeptidase family serine peptidase [Planctomycetes bacterium]|nr:prolyl oligopeptidase family serine peptidase [Planctomycetota bacterium]
MKYPETRRVDQVDEYHGVKVPDPYRWLEADVRESAEVADWVQQQNEIARKFLDAIPERSEIERRLTELWNYERYSTPTEEGGKYFYTKNDGLQNQSVLYVANSYSDEGRVLIDPNQWSEDGTVALSSYSPSEDGRYLAYARSEAGSDWQQVFVLEVETGNEIDGPLKWARFAGIDWKKDGTGFYYNRYPEPLPGQQHQAAALNQKIYFHKLGTKQSDDKLVYERPDHPDWHFWSGESDDGKYLVLSIARSTDPQNQVLVRDAAAAADAPFNELIGDFENQFWFIGNEGTRFYFLSDLNAPTKRVVSMDINQAGREHVTEIVPAREATLDGASILSGRIIGQYMVDVLSQVDVFDLQGTQLATVELPGKGTADGFIGDQSDEETFFAFTSYNLPSSVYRYDVLADKVEPIRQPRVKFDPEDFSVEQVFYHSKDGTRVPMMLAFRKDPERAESSPTPMTWPTLLYGYGGYSVPITPAFRPEYIAWMEMGGVLAVANLRGGGEYGEAWHLAGKTTKKQNVFDDFIAAAEWLIDEGRTSREQLAIMGGSNGGLLVGAVMVQRPDLFGACIPMVGVLDMLRFQEFTAGQFWRDEFGNIEKEDEFKALLAYSPYHNIKEGVAYPATLIMTADTDDRVVPMHSFKFAAALQRAQAGDAPILLRIEERAGHGAGTPVKKMIELAADRWAFVVKTLGMDVEQALK